MILRWLINIWFLCVCFNYAGSAIIETCPKTLKAQNLTGDFIIAGFIPAHYFAGQIYSDNFEGLTWTSAMLYALQDINKDKELLPGLILGYDIRDTCKEKSVALGHSLDVMLGTSYFTPTIKAKTSSDLCIKRNNSYSILAGVVGAATSGVSAVISNALSPDYIPLISYSATSSGLSKRSWYRNFIRTVPSDVYQSAAIVDLLVHFGWTYVSAFASDDEYGRVGLDELRRRTKEKGVCLAADRTFSSKRITNELPSIIADIKKFDAMSHVVILWCEVTDAETIMEETIKLGISNITWIGTETWTAQNLKRLNSTIIGLQLDSPVIQNFEYEMYNSVSLNCMNPWYVDLVHTRFPFMKFMKCKDFFFNIANILPRSKYPQVVAAIYAIAHGLHKTLNCSTTHCFPLKKGIDYKSLYFNILKSEFTIPSSKYLVKFDSGGEIMHNSYHFYTYNASTVSQLRFGYWSGNNTLVVNENLIYWGKHGKPKAHCSSNCLKGSYRINGSSECCWTCASCSGHSISTQINQYVCRNCSETQISNSNHTQCLQLQEIRFRSSDTAGLILLIVSAFGTFCAIFVLTVFIKYWDTPVIKSSSREMSCIQLISLLLLFCLPVVYTFKLTALLCMFRIFTFGFLLTTIIALIVIKTYRLLRVFNGRFQKVSRFLQNKYQIFFSYILVLAQFLATVFWFWSFPPHTKFEINVKDLSYYTICSTEQEVIFFAVLFYIFILALLSGYMAFRARKLPENFNEGQYISFAMFTCCIVWLMYLPLHFSLSPDQKLISFLSTNLCSTFCLLFILYGYKVRIILFCPKLNSPEHFRKKAADAAVQSFIKDVKEVNRQRHKQSEKILFDLQRNKSMTQSLPNRGLTVALDNIDGIEMVQLIKQVSVTHRRTASFSNIPLKNKEYYKSDPVSMEILSNEIVSAMKKSMSTPMLFEGTDRPKPKRESALGKLNRSHNNLIFSQNSAKEDQSLLDSDSQNSTVLV